MREVSNDQYLDIVESWGCMHEGVHHVVNLE
jgi:hypothetical protein